MLHVLIVEDDATKYGCIHNSLTSDGIESAAIHHAVCAAEALERLASTRYDLMLLDVNIPRRLGEAPHRGGGIEVLREITRHSDYKKPRYILGITAFEDIMEEFGTEFEERLWALIHYSEQSDRWISQLRLLITYIKAVRESDNFSDGVTYGTDLAIVAALDTVEFRAIRELDCQWQPLRLAHDETRYLTGTISGKKNFSVIAAAAPRMGMAASSVLVSKIIHQFRPRYVAMVGICAGRADKVNIGDIIVADPTWDWGSGKIESRRNVPKFLPSPHQLDLDPDLVSVLKEVAEDAMGMAEIKSTANGKKPEFELVVRFGPAASGAAVVADKKTFESLLAQHRGLLGIDMEAYGVASAVLGSGKPRPKAILVKAVCDYADKDKDDDYQEYAATVSARFLLKAARRFL